MPAAVASSELRADVDVEALHVESRRQRPPDRLERVGCREAELRAVPPGADRLVGVGLDAGGDAHEDAPTPAAAARSISSQRVEHDECGPGLGRGPQLRVRLVVAVNDESLAR